MSLRHLVTLTLTETTTSPGVPPVPPIPESISPSDVVAQEKVGTHGQELPGKFACPLKKRFATTSVQPQFLFVKTIMMITVARNPAP